MVIHIFGHRNFYSHWLVLFSSFQMSVYSLPQFAQLTFWSFNLKSPQTCLYLSSNESWVSRLYETVKWERLLAKPPHRAQFSLSRNRELWKALVTWAVFCSCSAESAHTWGLSSFESISSLPWCSMSREIYWGNVWLNRFICSLCFYFQKTRWSSVTWL